MQFYKLLKYVLRCKMKRSKMIQLFCGLRTQKTGLIEVDLEPISKRGSDKINMLK